MQRRAGRLFLVALVALVGTAAPASPMDIAEHLARLAVMNPELEKKGLHRPAACTEPDTQTFWKVLAGIRDEREYGRKLRGKAALGFQGDGARLYGGPAANPESAEQAGADQYKVTAGLKLNRGTYPGEFKFNAEVDVRLQGGAFEQNTHDLLVAYDHWMKPLLEAFVFGSQFSDSFMEIDQRYEVGAGVFVGPYFGPKRQGSEPLPLLSDDLPQPDCKKCPGDSTREKCAERAKKKCSKSLVKDWEKNLKDVKKRLQKLDQDNLEPEPADLGPSWLLCYAGVLGGPKQAMLAVRDLEALFKDIDDEQWQDAFNAQKQRDKMFRLGVAVSVFAELEHATLKYTPLAAGTGSATTPRTVPITATPRYRFVVRPTFECWPSRRWAFRGDWYLKLPLGDTSTTIPGEAQSRYDYRYDLDITGEFTVNEKEIGQPGNVTVGFRYRRIFDNVPPFYQPAGASAAPFLIAPDTHTRISMDFSIRW